MTPFADAVTRLKNKVSAIDTAAQKQETPTGATQGKAGARDALEDTLFLMCEALGALAHMSNDQDLLARRTSLDRESISWTAKVCRTARRWCWPRRIIRRLNSRLCRSRKRT